MSKYEPTTGATDEWYTPAYVFDLLGETFDLDVAAPEGGCPAVPAPRWVYRGSLDAQWFGFVWMNPPYGGRNGLVPWMEKFFKHGNGICLVPDRTSAPWWQTAAWSCAAMLFVDHKIRFLKQDGAPGAQPSNGSCLFAAGERGASALRNAVPELGVCVVRA